MNMTRSIQQTNNEVRHTEAVNLFHWMENFKQLENKIALPIFWYLCGVRLCKFFLVHAWRSLLIEPHLCCCFVGTPQALLQNCITFGAFSVIIEGFNKAQPALALPSSGRSKSRHFSTLPPLAIPLPHELKESFSFFCQSIRKRDMGSYPSAH